MKTTINYILFFLIAQMSTVQTFADSGILGWIDSKKLRNWDIHLEDIPNAIVGATNFLMGFAWTIAVIFVIIWAYQLLLGSTKQDVTTWRNTILMALAGFAIASLAWLIVKLIIDNFLTL